MPTLYPPDYPYRPDAPLLSFGPSFSEEIARSVLRATWHENDEQPHETDTRAAATLTMLEGFHPRDHLECMIAAQGVALHCAEMDSLARATRPGQTDAMVIKWRANAALMNRSFLATSRELDRRQSKPLPPRPPDPGATPPDPPSGPECDTPADLETADPATDGAKPRRKRASAKTAPPPASVENFAASPAPFPDPDDLPEVVDDSETRPDGTPGSLTAYAPVLPPPEVSIPRIALIMEALATRPSPYRIVNDPGSQIETHTGLPRSASNEIAGPDAAVPPVEANRDRGFQRGPLDLREHIFSGDALSQFASARFDPDAPVPSLFEDDDAVVELELVSTGGDPEAEAHRAELIAAHPEGKPIVTFRYGPVRPAEDGPDPAAMERSGKAPPDT